MIDLLQDSFSLYCRPFCVYTVDESLGGTPVALVAAISGLGAAVLLTACGLLAVYRRPKRPPAVQLHVRESDA